MAILDTPQPDLSLEELRFLVTVAKTKSLTTAASQYGISMGAASRRLSHLREVFDDVSLHKILKIIEIFR